MNINIYTFKEPEDTGGQWGATTSDKPFESISGFSDSELGAIKEFCIALIGIIDVKIEDVESTWRIANFWDWFTYKVGW